MHVEQGDVAFAAFHAADVGAVHTGFVGELLLGQPSCGSQCCHSLPEFGEPLVIHSSVVSHVSAGSGSHAYWLLMSGDFFRLLLLMSSDFPCFWGRMASIFSHSGNNF